MIKSSLEKIMIRVRWQLRRQRIRKQRRLERRARRGCLARLTRGLLAYVLLCAVFGFLFGFYANPTYKLKDHSVYQIKMQGVVEERANDMGYLGSLTMFEGLQAENVGLEDLISNIRLAKEDAHVEGIYLNGGNFQIGQASAKALRDELISFKQSGKWIVAYAANYSQTNYYICSVADRIYLNPVGSVDWKGISLQKTYYTRLLEKLGVEMQIVKVGTFKSAVEPYFRTSMSEADSLQSMRYAQGLWREIRQGVSAARAIDEAVLDSLADLHMGLRSAEECLAAGLVDELCYQEDMERVFEQRLSTDEYHLVRHSQMTQVERAESKATDKVVVLYAFGEITDQGGTGIAGDKMVKEIKKIRKDDDVKAVVLRVNSPGGSANASEQIWHAVQTLRAKGLPVVVSMGDYAASGGYYISCGANYIFAEPNTLTGSIGIFGTIPNIKGLRDKIGLDVDGIATHQHSSLEQNMLMEGMNSEEARMMQSMVERGYELFTSRCAAGRGMSQDSIKAIAEGRVWLGEDALALGLVDELGGLQQAIDKAAALAGVTDYRVEAMPEKKDMLTELLEMLDDDQSPEEQLLARMRQFVERSRIMARMEDIVVE